MAKAETEELFNAPISDVFNVISDYEKYPDFLPEVKSTKILKKSKTSIDVEMTVDFVKKATYVIRVKKKKDLKIWWTLVSGDLFEKNDGCWELEKIGNQTQVKYSLDVEFKIYVPGMILKKAVAVSLPSMVKGFKKRVEDL